LASFELSKFADTLVKKLSGGLVRRAELCLAWVHEPAIVFLDEPTTGLDPVARHDFWQFLLKRKREKGTTVVVATHLVDEAELCDEISLFSRGKVVARGRPCELAKGFEEDIVCVVAKDIEKTKSLLSRSGVASCRVSGAELSFQAPQARKLISELTEYLGDAIDSISIRKAGLESFYRSKIGEAL
jgi:ABC-2 type transport system ATP-binding protein